MKIILELSQKMKTEFKFDQMSLTDDDKTAVDALVSLGFKPSDAKTVVSKLAKGLTVEEKIKTALQKTNEKK